MVAVGSATSVCGRATNRHLTTARLNWPTDITRVQSAQSRCHRNVIVALDGGGDDGGDVGAGGGGDDA